MTELTRLSSLLSQAKVQGLNVAAIALGWDPYSRLRFLLWEHACPGKSNYAEPTVFPVDAKFGGLPIIEAHDPEFVGLVITLQPPA